MIFTIKYSHIKDFCEKYGISVDDMMNSIEYIVCSLNRVDLLDKMPTYTMLSYILKDLKPICASTMDDKIILKFKKFDYNLIVDLEKNGYTFTAHKCNDFFKVLIKDENRFEVLYD